jgi:hypothetical protein
MTSAVENQVKVAVQLVVKEPWGMGPLGTGPWGMEPWATSAGESLAEVAEPLMVTEL